jgi:hypothetical protein
LKLHEAPRLRQAPAVWVDLQPALQDGASHSKPAKNNDDVQDSERYYQGRTQVAEHKGTRPHCRKEQRALRHVEMQHLLDLEDIPRLPAVAAAWSSGLSRHRLCGVLLLLLMLLLLLLRTFVGPVCVLLCAPSGQS